MQYVMTNSWLVQTKAKTDVYRLQCFRSQGALSVDSSLHLRMYFLQKPSFPEPRATADETDIERIGDIHFLERTDPAVIAMFQVQYRAFVN
jgi:glutamate dehydrogenase